MKQKPLYSLYSEVAVILFALMFSVPVSALDADARYTCVSATSVTYFRPDDEVKIKKGHDAECVVQLRPSDLKWATDCPFYQLLKNDEVEILSFDSGYGFSTIKLVAINRKTVVVKTLSINKRKNSPNLEFTLAIGGNARHGACSLK